MQPTEFYKIHLASQIRLIINMTKLLDSDWLTDLKLIVLPCNKLFFQTIQNGDSKPYKMTIAEFWQYFKTSLVLSIASCITYTYFPINE